jgi:hypothetical protein
MKLKPEVNKEAILRELEEKAKERYKESWIREPYLVAYLEGINDLFDLLKEETTKIEPIYPSGLREAWLDYRAYRKREGKGWYKTLKTEQTAIDGLMKRSNNDVNCLKDAIQQTIECRYSGIFPKPKSNSRDRSTQINATLRKGGFTI